MKQLGSLKNGLMVICSYQSAFCVVDIHFLPELCLSVFCYFFQFQNQCSSTWQLKMGISRLLQFIKDAAEPINVKKYKGQSVAVDTYCWLHKGAFSCAEKLAKGEPTDQ